MKLSIYERLERRDFIKWIGSAALALPTLELFELQAKAQTAKQAKFAVFIYTNDGFHPPSYFPPNGSTDPTASPILQPLAPLKSKVTLVIGVDLKLMVDGGHGADGHFSGPTMFTATYKNVGGQTATATGASIDQVVASAVAKQVNLPVPLLTITAQAGKDGRTFRYCWGWILTRKFAGSGSMAKVGSFPRTMATSSQL